MSTYLAKPQRFLVRPAPGWKELTLSEVLEILASPLQKFKFEPKAVLEDGLVVISDCDYRQALELIARVTTAHDVDWVIQSGRISSRGDWKPFLEKSGVSKLWNDPLDFTFHLSSQASHTVVGTEKEIKDLAKSVWPFFSDGDEAALAAETERPLQRIRIESSKNRHRILVSMGGAPLYKRGYKVQGLPASAPLPEHHASACFRWCLETLKGSPLESMPNNRWSIVTPFAGTGTTGIEAAARVLNIAPALTRPFFACEGFSFHPEATMSTIRQRLRQKVMGSSSDLKLIFGDLNSDVTAALDHQVENFMRLAGVSIPTEIKGNDFLLNPLELMSLALQGGVVFLPLNPPYGNRLAKGSGGDVIYKRLGEAIKACADVRTLIGYVICPDESTWGHLQRGLKGFELHTRHFSHGGDDVRLVAFSSVKNTNCPT